MTQEEFDNLYQIEEPDEKSETEKVKGETKEATWEATITDGDKKIEEEMTDG